MDRSDLMAAVVAVIICIIIVLMTANAIDAEMAHDEARVRAHVGRMAK